MLLGLAVGVIMVAADVVLSDIGSTSGFPHPAFPLSIVSSAAAGIGEEILFRGFVMGLWGLLLMALLRRRVGRPAVLWIANGLAALAFSAGHLPGVMFLLQAATPAEIPAPVLVEVFVLNSLLGLIAGARSARDGLVAAMGVHFWGDVVWHVVWPLM